MRVMQQPIEERGDGGRVASCDELCGGIDASQYEDYVLVLLFTEYVSSL